MKLVNFCVAILKLKIGGKATFLACYALLFKKSKNPTQKTCAVYGEGAVTDPKRVKSGL